MPRKLPRKNSVNPVSVTTWVRRSLMRSASPLAEAIIARVMMNGRPCRRRSAPVDQAAAQSHGERDSTITTGPYDCVATVVIQTLANATIDPTDRSMPPAMMTKVMPTLTTPIAAVSRSMMEMLS